MPTQVYRGCKRIQLCQKTPFGRKAPSTHMNSTTRFLPTGLTQLPCGKSKSWWSIPLGIALAKPQSPERFHMDRF